MLEVCFNDSVKGSLAVAPHCEKQVASQKQAVSLGGKREEIAGIFFGFSEGDIQAPFHLEDCPRKEYIGSIFSFDRYDENEDMAKSIDDFWQNCIEDLEKIKSNPSKIRIWLDNTPDAKCGLLFLADLLKDSETEIHIVELPQTIKREDNYMIEYRGWGEIEPQLFGTFLDREKVLTKAEIAAFSNRWQVLKSENMPLRVVENGLVVSADDSFYDHLIRKEFPRDTCKVSQIIGNALGRQNILTGDIFITKRIQAFISSGELRIINNGTAGFYGTIVSCAK